MSGKIKTYLLLVTVLGIWLTLGYQILTGFSADHSESQKVDLNLTFNPKKIKDVDTFSIGFMNRDPFLGTLSSRTPKKPILRNRIVKDKIQVPVTYHGSIKRQNSADMVFVINVNGIQHLMKKGQNINDVTLVKGSDTEIIIRYKELQKTISKQE